MALHLSDANAARLLKGQVPTRHKYGAQRVEHEGHVFDSKRERNWFIALRMREKAGEIADLRLQVPFDLHVCGVKVCAYVADYTWLETSNGEVVVADAKGVRTAVYKLKSRMFCAEYGVTVTEL